MSKQGKCYIGIGLLLLAAALLLTVYNLQSDIKAAAAADAVLEQLEPEIRENTHVNLPVLPDGGSLEEVYIPDYILNPEMDMPEETVNGYRYIGVLEIPKLLLELPIISQWSYPNLKVAPCRYAGSAYLDNLVIAAHNFYSHFGYLRQLSPGDEITFTDVDGNVFRYAVAELEILSPFAVEEMTGGDWALTLFTCTTGGASRITVRCVRVEDSHS